MKKHLFVLLAHLLLQMITSHAMEKSSAQLTTRTQDSVRKLPQELQEQIAAHPQIALRKKIDNLSHDMQWEVRNWRQKSSYDAPHSFLLKARCLTHHDKRHPISAADYSLSKRFLAVAENCSDIVIYDPSTMREVQRSSHRQGPTSSTSSLLFNPQDDTVLFLISSCKHRARLMRFYPDNSRYLCRTDYTDLPLRQGNLPLVHAAAWHQDGEDNTYATGDILYTFNRKANRLVSDIDIEESLKTKNDERICGIHIDDSSSVIVTKREGIFDSPRRIDECCSTKMSFYHTTAQTSNRTATIRVPNVCRLHHVNPLLLYNKGKKIVLLPSEYNGKKGKRATVYDTTTGQELFVLASKAPITTMCALPSGSVLITASAEPKTGGLTFRVGKKIFIIPSCDENKGLITFWETRDNSAKELFTFPVADSVSLLKVNPDGDRLFVTQASGFFIFSIPALFALHRKLSHVTLAQEDLLEGLHEAIRITSRINANQKQWADFRAMPKRFQSALIRHIRPQRDVIDIIRDSSKKEDGISSIFKRVAADLATIQQEREHPDRTVHEQKLLDAFQKAVEMPGRMGITQQHWNMFRKLPKQFQNSMLGYIAKLRVTDN